MMILKKYSLLLLLSIPAYSADLEFVNTTNFVARIDSLSNKCQKQSLVKEESPVVLSPGESKTFHNAIPVIHIYTVCGNGLCSSSAFGLKSGVKKYTLNITTKNGMIDLSSTPDHWVGNIECP